MVLVRDPFVYRDSSCLIDFYYFSSLKKCVPILLISFSAVLEFFQFFRKVLDYVLGEELEFGSGSSLFVRKYYFHKYGEGE